MPEFIENFKEYAFKMLDIAYRDFKKTDTEYQEITAYLKRGEDRYNAILNALNEEDKKFMMEYIDKEYNEAVCANEKLYMSGYKDCVKLLKEIGVL